MDTAGVIGAITYWAPTDVFVTVRIHGKKAHAGVEPEKGINAVKVAAEAIAAMPLGRIDEETVANIGTITGGEARNIVPGEVVLKAWHAATTRPSSTPSSTPCGPPYRGSGAARRHLRLRSRGDLPDLQDRRVGTPLPRGGQGDRDTRHRGVPPEERWGHRRQLLQRGRDMLRRVGYRHGGRARGHRAHRHRGHGHGVQDPRDNRDPATTVKSGASRPQVDTLMLGSRSSS